MGVSGNLILLGNMNVLLAFSLNYGYKTRKVGNSDVVNQI